MLGHSDQSKGEGHRPLSTCRNNVRSASTTSSGTASCWVWTANPSSTSSTGTASSAGSNARDHAHSVEKRFATSYHGASSTPKIQQSDQALRIEQETEDPFRGKRCRGIEKKWNEKYKCRVKKNSLIEDEFGSSIMKTYNKPINFIS